MKTRRIGPAMICWLLLGSGCQPPADDPKGSQSLRILPPVPLGPVAGQPHQGLFSAGSDLILTLSRAGGFEAWQSPDGALNWSSAGFIPGTLALNYHPGCSGFHSLSIERGQLFHVWSRQGVIERDPLPASLDSLPQSPHFAWNGAGALGFSWIEDAAGWPELYFSTSQDHGKSWSLPSRVNTESRGKDVDNAVPFSDGVGWGVAWPENRSRTTLYDVYFSTSTDGIHWSPSVRVNDDQEPVWNVDVQVTADPDYFYFAFQDYREKNTFGDYDSNIYFGRFDRSRRQMEANLRINKIPDGGQSFPKLALSPETSTLLLCWLDERRRLSYDLVCSNSFDRGATWSADFIVNSPDERAQWVQNPLIAAGQERIFYLSWGESGREERSWIRKLEATAGEAASLPQVPPSEEIPGPLISEVEARLLASYSWEAGSLEDWQEESGSWVEQDRVLLVHSRSVSALRWKPDRLADFVLEGKFRLLPVHHRSPLFYFRVREPDSTESGYALTSHFRYGAQLLQLDGPFDSEFSTIPLAGRRFPFQHSRWYPFRLVVAGNRMDYFIDGKWLLSYDKLELTAAGSLLLGSLGSPVEFDDIQISSLDDSKVVRD